MVTNHFREVPIIEKRLRQKLVQVGRSIRNYRDAIDKFTQAKQEPPDWLLTQRDIFEAQRDLLLSILDGRPQFPDDYEGEWFYE